MRENCFYPSKTGVGYITLDGFTICKKIRELYSCPIIFLTAKVSEKDKLRGYAQGGDDYITKPFSLPVLLLSEYLVLQFFC